MAKIIDTGQLGLVFPETTAILPVPELTPKTLTQVKKKPMSGEAARQHIIRLFNDFRYKYGIYDVFRDFCEMAACSISNSVDKHHFDEREAQYLWTAGRYLTEELNKFAEIFSTLVKALEYFGPQDVLGQIFQMLEINSKDRGQFFTPQHVSECMGKMTAVGVGELVKEKGYVTMCEPAVGGGSTVFGFCKAMTDEGLDFTTQLHVTAIDVDSRCANMAYIQMSLLGIPGIIYHGDALSMEMRSAWVTPVHVLGGWYRKLAVSTASDIALDT